MKSLNIKRAQDIFEKFDVEWTSDLDDLFEKKNDDLEYKDVFEIVWSHLILHKHINFMLKEYETYCGQVFDYSLNYVYSEMTRYKVAKKELHFSDYDSFKMGIYHIIASSLDTSWSRYNTQIGKDELVQGFWYETPLKRRGNVIEVIEDVEYLLNLIDWMGKNGLNTMFFTFRVWDKVSMHIKDALENRNIKVTLGGHSLKHLLNEDSIDVDTFEFANNYDLVNSIKLRCESSRLISNISLWPEDIGIDQNKKDEFFKDYILFCKLLQKEIPWVKVEHIAYNAGLSWGMLELPNSIETGSLNTLFAFWGRDYSTSIDSDAESQKRASRALNDWINQTRINGTSLTIFEYYSDFYFMTELYPKLANRIHDDVHRYKTLGIDGILNLYVPLLKSRYNNDNRPDYNWKYYSNYNSFVFAKSCWNISLSDIKQEWWGSEDTQIRDQQSIYERIERVLAPITKYNFELFPKRFVDVEGNFKELKEELILLEKDIKELLKGPILDDNDRSYFEQLALGLEFYGK